MNFQDIYPVWNKLPEYLQNMINDSITDRIMPQGTIIHHGSFDCIRL